MGCLGDDVGSGVPQIAADLLRCTIRQSWANSGHFRAIEQCERLTRRFVNSLQSIDRRIRLAAPYLNLKFSRLRSATDRQPINFISRSISE